MAEKHIGLIDVAIRRLLKRKEFSALLDTGRVELGDLWSSGYIVLKQAKRTSGRRRGALSTYLVNQVYWKIYLEYVTYLTPPQEATELPAREAVDYISIRRKVTSWLQVVGFSDLEAKSLWLILGENRPRKWVAKRTGLSVWRLKKLEGILSDFLGLEQNPLYLPPKVYL